MSKFYDTQLKQIRSRGYRVTPQRQMILNALVNHSDHATALEIYELVSEKTPGINKATIYRVLEFFCEMQLASKTEMGGRTYYEVLGQKPHHHLVCTKCDGVEVLSDHHFDELVQHLAQEHGFHADLKHLAIPGVCQACQE